MLRTPAAVISGKPLTSSRGAASNNIPVHVLFGSNAGSAEAFVPRIAIDANTQDYLPAIGTLESAVGKRSKDGAVVIVTAWYESQPPDNARHFGILRNDD